MSFSLKKSIPSTRRSCYTFLLCGDVCFIVFSLLLLSIFLLFFLHYIFNIALSPLGFTTAFGSRSQSPFADTEKTGGLRGHHQPIFWIFYSVDSNKNIMENPSVSPFFEFYPNISGLEFNMLWKNILLTCVSYRGKCRISRSRLRSRSNLFLGIRHVRFATQTGSHITMRVVSVC
jgi:hypothetical protein